MKIYKKVLKLPNDLRIFCPFCQVIFENDGDYVKVRDIKKFKSTICKCKNFSMSDYKRSDFRKLHFQDPTMNSRESIREYIANIVMKFTNEGYSSRQIEQITHISRNSINSIIKEQELLHSVGYEIEEFSLEIFLLDIIKIDKEEFESIRIGENPSSLKNVIIKLKEYGCDYIFIQKLLRVSYSTISSFLRGTAKLMPTGNRYKFLIKGDCPDIIIIKQLNYNSST